MKKITLTPTAYRVGNTTRFVGVVEVRDETGEVIHLFSTSEVLTETRAQADAEMRLRLEQNRLAHGRSELKVPA